MAISTYLANKLNDHVLRHSPDTLYVALFTASGGLDANDSGTFGPNEVSTSGTAYARVAITATVWNASSGKSAATSTNIEFPQATSNWGTITHVALMDASTIGGGNVLFWGALTSSVAPVTNDVVRFAAGDLTSAFT